MEYFQKGASEILKILNTSLEGLSEEEVKIRILTHGKNVLEKKRRKRPFEIFFSQFKDFLIFILIASAIVSGFVGELLDTITIIVILFINSFIGFIQEYRAEKAMEALSKMASPYAVVIRKNKIKKIPAEELVPGDIVLLEAGDIVPADLRL